MFARSSITIFSLVWATFAAANPGVKELRVSTLEQDAHITLITQSNCPVRIRDSATERAAGESETELRAQHVDCEELVQNANLFPDLEVLPGWKGDFDSLDLSWPDDVDFSAGQQDDVDFSDDDEAFGDDFYDGEEEGGGEFEWADLADEGDFEPVDA